MLPLTTPQSLQPQKTPSGLIAMIRATLPPVAAGRGASELGNSERVAPPKPFTSEELASLADQWRARSALGDEGAELVAQALELVAARRGKRTRFQAFSERITDLMQLH